MKTSFISNLSVANSMRSTVNSIQQDLIKSQREVVSGRIGDISEELGSTTARSLNLHRDLDRMETLQATNSIVTQRLSSSQLALETISNAGQTSLNTLVALAGSNDKTQLATAIQTFTDVLDQMTDAGNTSVNGEYLFGGTNTDQKPLADYMKDENGIRALVSARIALMPPAASITPAQMQALIDDIELGFNGADWTQWSAAANDPMMSRITQTEVVQSSTTANTDGYRYMALSSVIGIELLNMDLTPDTRKVVSDAAIGFMGKAITEIDNERSLLGLSENRVSIANSMLSSQVDIVKLNIDDLEGVDVYEASTRITNLESQMEISYNLTARLSRLSLVNEL